jgi:hypothetical protein
MPGVFGIWARRNTQTSYCLLSDNYQMNEITGRQVETSKRGWLLVP